MKQISIAEAVELLQMSRSTFYLNYIKPKIINVIASGRKKMIDVTEIIRIFSKDVRYNQNLTKIYDVQQLEIVGLLKNQLQQAKDREIWYQQQLEECKNRINELENKKGFWK